MRGGLQKLAVTKVALNIESPTVEGRTVKECRNFFSTKSALCQEYDEENALRFILSY